MTLSTNPQLELARDYVFNTDKNIFLTGKAGTGKTTFLHRIKEESAKRIAVVAPTGVAAINARGMTIHSFFQLPFSPFVPGGSTDPSRQRKMRSEKIRLIRSLDLLIIDEISMVRADVLDAIDDVLRRYRDLTRPFGGVQLLMIGDLHQLPPVVRPDTWDMLRMHYTTPYFFGSNALRQTDPVVIQLTHIYRQADDVFINLLNKVRDNQIDEEALRTLNSRYRPDFKPTEGNPYITLTSHNAAANSLNEEKLKELPGKLHKFKAEISENFPPHAYPTDEVIELKVGAQVMFIKNDLQEPRRWYNGKIGKITGFGRDEIHVKCPEESETFKVTTAEWENVKYTLDEKTKEVSEEIAGVFTQYPLKLAWAITIHKSQGLTFERAVIDAEAAFAHGQVYVALSRCKSFEGIVLRTPLNYRSVRTDNAVKNYSSEAERNAPTEEDLRDSKQIYQQNLILDLFKTTKIETALRKAERVFTEHQVTLTPRALTQLLQWKAKAEETAFRIAEKFQPQLRAYFRQTNLPEDNQALLDRIRKGAAYFSEKLNDELLPALLQIPVESDNTKVKKLALEKMRALQKTIYVKNACFVAAKAGFSAQEHLRARTDAQTEFDRKGIGKTDPKKIIAPQDSPHPHLYILLRNWRDAVADRENTKVFNVLPAHAILEMTHYLPTDKENLQRIKGVGKVKIAKYGLEIIEMIENYCHQQGIKSNVGSPQVLSPKLKVDSKRLSLDLFLQGFSIDAVAKQRGLVRSTIEGHLAHFVGTGDLSLFKVLEKGKAEEIIAFFDKNPEAGSKDAKDFFGGKYSYGELKMVRGHLSK